MTRHPFDETWAMYGTSFEDEPLAITVATILIREDMAAGTYIPGTAWDYLTAAREAAASAATTETAERQ